MTQKNKSLPLPPADYSQEYFNRLVRELQIALNGLSSGGPLSAGSDLTQTNVKRPISALTLTNLPTSTNNLPTGSVWNSSGTLKIV